jgi:DNA-binding PadR family transcriptional regulator
MKKLRIGNLIDLSFVEIITLNLLLEYGKPIVRYTLYVIVNELIQNNKINVNKFKNLNLSAYEARYLNYIKKKEKSNSDLSTSSFYNNLSNLEKRGLVKFNVNHKGRVKTVEATPLTNYLLKYLLQFFMDSSVIPDVIQFDEGLKERIKNISNKDHLENIMGVWFSKHIFLRLVNLFKTLADEVFILSKKENYDSYIETELMDIHISKVYKKRIREPNDVIEMVAIPDYRKNTNFFGMSEVEVLKELHRILQPGGMIIVVTKADFPLTDDITADLLLKIYKESISDTLFTEEELKKDLEKAGFTKNKMINYQGCVVGIGWVD